MSNPHIPVMCWISVGVQLERRGSQDFLPPSTPGCWHLAAKLGVLRGSVCHRQQAASSMRNPVRSNLRMFSRHGTVWTIS